MNYIYVDESIHVQASLITIALVCGKKDLSLDVNNALKSCGFQPNIDEFKSSSIMSSNQNFQKLRDSIKSIIYNEGKIALAFCDLSERSKIKEIAINLLHKLPKKYIDTGGIIYFDQGIDCVEVQLPYGWTCKDKCDSRMIGGIQLADCAAHTASRIILSEVGLMNKRVQTYERFPEPEVDLAWELWIDMRHSIASEEPILNQSGTDAVEYMFKPFGFHYTPKLSNDLQLAIKFRLSQIWLGCIL